MNQAVREGFVQPTVVDTAPPLLMQPGVVDTTPPIPISLWPIKVKLQKPIVGNTGQMLTEVSFREPTGNDIFRAGNPVFISLDNQIMIDDKRMMMMIAFLSGVLRPLLDSLSSRDYASCAWKLRDFFLPDPESLT